MNAFEHIFCTSAAAALPLEVNIQTLQQEHQYDDDELLDSDNVPASAEIDHIPTQHFDVEEESEVEATFAGTAKPINTEPTTRLTPVPAVQLLPVPPEVTECQSRLSLLLHPL
jgi:hypothetical protein